MENKRLNTDGLLLGMHRAIVVDTEKETNSPTGVDDLLRAKIRLIDVWEGITDEHLPWAEYMLDFGARPLEGRFKPAKVDDVVWVQFAGGNPLYPIIMGAVHFAPEGKLNLPPEAYAGDDCFDHKRTKEEPKPSPAEYHKDTAFRVNNILGQITHEEAYRITHLTTGTAIEITKEGHLVLHCEKDLFISVVGAERREIKGDSVVEHTGNYTEQVDKNFTGTYKGNVKETITGTETKETTGISKDTYKDNRTEQVDKNFTGVYKGNVNETITGTETKETTGISKDTYKNNRTEQVDKDFTGTYKGNKTVTVTKALNITVTGNAVIKSQGTMNLESTGKMTIKSGAGIDMNAPRINLN